MTTYNDIDIGSLDEAYIERISEEVGIDSGDAELYSLQGERPNIANDIIYHIISGGIEKLDISEESKEKLRDSIYCNCIDSGLDIADGLVFPKKERKIIQDFKEIF